MNDKERPDQEESTSGAIERVAESELSWEVALTQADSGGEGSAGEGPGPRAGTPRGLAWLKLLFPILVLAGYVGLKAWEGRGTNTNLSAMPAALQNQPDSISGVPQTETDSFRLDAKTKAFVGGLETLAARNQWKDLRARIASPDGEAFRPHPVVRAMESLAASRMGERSVELERKLIALDAQFLPVRDRFPELYHGIELARADQILSRCGTREILTRNTDLLFRLLGPSAATLRDVDVRMAAAKTFEEQADRLVEEAKGLISDDTYKIQEARSLYQTGLRFLVAADGWKSLEAISPRARPEIEVLLQKMRDANRKIHGPALPFSGADSATWTGRKGDPVHDAF